MGHLEMRRNKSDIHTFWGKSDYGKGLTKYTEEAEILTAGFPRTVVQVGALIRTGVIQVIFVHMSPACL